MFAVISNAATDVRLNAQTTEPQTSLGTHYRRERPCGDASGAEVFVRTINGDVHQRPSLDGLRVDFRIGES